MKALPYLFEFWAHDHQLPPKGDWRTWVILGGRGAGKTRAGAEWVRQLVEGPTPTKKGAYRRIGLIANSLQEAKDIIVFGESGILSICPPDRMPKWIEAKRALYWPNGAEAKIFSANRPETFRGPQFDAIWLDEFAKWEKADEVWEMLQFCLRLGKKPRALITTTPRDRPILKAILDDKTTVETHASTHVNRANLSPGFVENLERLYKNTRLGDQEIEGKFNDIYDDAIFSGAVFDKLIHAPKTQMEKIIVAIDPPASHHENSDECGIIVAGIEEGEGNSRKVYILDDLSISQAKPQDWAKRAILAYHEWGAVKVIAEVNQGGNMVETILCQIDPNVNYEAKRAHLGKLSRAIPVAGLYEQGLVKHRARFETLEAQMKNMRQDGYVGRGSPDRLDAMVWAVHDLIFEPMRNQIVPQIRNI